MKSLKNVLLVAALTAVMGFAASTIVQAQSELYPQHFDLEQVVLMDGPMRTALITNSRTLLKYDADRLMTPFVREAGLSKTTNRSNKY